MAGAPEVFVCTGCGIGTALDVPRLCAAVRGESAAEVHTHPFLCGPEGAAALREVAGRTQSPLVVAACSPRVNAPTFRLEGTVVERVNLREQVVWSHTPLDQDTQELAEDAIRMGLTRAARSRSPEPQPLEPAAEETILVVGGGVAGMTAALEAAAAGQPVVLVEKEAQLGGWLARLHRLSPRVHPFRDLEPADGEELAARVLSDPRIRVLTSASVESTSGQPGKFEVVVRQDEAPVTLRVGAIILAAGWRPYDASRLGHLGYDRCANVVTGIQLEEMAKEGRIVRPSDGRPATRVAIALCAGSRDPEHLPYCSTFCCAASLKQALYVRQQNPDASVYVIYRDLRTPGSGEMFYRRVQEEEGVFLTQGQVTGVRDGEDGEVVVDALSPALGGPITLAVDLLVLATGMVPVAAEESVLNLNYRQGPKMPTDTYGFPDSNFICFPYETQRTGIYAAGCVRQPLDTVASRQDAAGAALKAIQCIRLTARGAAVHPRSGDLSLPRFFLQNCTQCKRCTEECPFGALDDDAGGTPGLNPGRCRRCGTCMGACPARIISFDDYSIDQLSAVVKAVSVPEEGEHPRILAFTCENDAYPALDMTGINHRPLDPSVRVIPVRCLGSLNMAVLTDAFSRGIDGVMLMGCRTGPDYQCHFVRGSELATRRLENLRESLDRLMIEPERVRFLEVAITDFERIPELWAEFAQEVRRMGPNPFKGM